MPKLVFWALTVRVNRPCSCGDLSSSAGKSRHAAARRTHQPLGCRISGLAGAFLGRLRRDCGRDYPRPLLPR
ncbi:Uncharacterised protein [Vibrio cholerae]|nr:Uncharacterised protein [Vibrio cholerae]